MASKLSSGVTFVVSCIGCELFEVKYVSGFESAVGRSKEEIAYLTSGDQMLCEWYPLVQSFFCMCGVCNLCLPDSSSHLHYRPLASTLSSGVTFVESCIGCELFEVKFVLGFESAVGRPKEEIAYLTSGDQMLCE
jgi:hypothetical protein